MGNFWRLSAVLVAMAWASSVGAQVGPGPGGGSGSSGAVYGPTAAGTAAANPPVIIGGTVDGTATGAVDNLKVSGGLAFINCANCSGSGASAADEAAYVAGTSLFAPSGGFFQTTATTGPLTTGQQGLVQMTAYRAFMMNVRNSSGAELGLTAAPFIVAGAGVAGTPAGGVMSIQGVASGTVVPVSGTVAFSNSTIAVTNAGTFAVQLTGATNNINNISGTVSLPTGAATSANQPTNAAQASTTSGQTGNLVQCAVTTSAPTYTTAQTDPLSCDTAGNVRAIASQAGTWTVQQGGISTALANAWPFKITDATNGPAAVKAASVAPVATDPALVVAISPNSVNANGPASPASSAPVTLPTSNNNFVLEPANTDNHTVIVNGSGHIVQGIHVFNNSATINYGRLYNAGTGFNGCASATNLAYEFHIPASTSDAGFAVPIPQGLDLFSSGISICVTSGYGQTNTTGATATAISLNVMYR